MIWENPDEDLYAADFATSALGGHRLIENLLDTAQNCHPSTGFAWCASNRPVISTAPGFTRGPVWLHRVDPWCATLKTAIQYEVANGAAAAGSDGVRARLRVDDMCGAWSDLDVTSSAQVVTLECPLTIGQAARVVVVQVEIESYIGADVGAATVGFGGTGAYQMHVHIDRTGLTDGKSHYAIGFASVAYGDEAAGIQWHHVGRVLGHTHGGGNDTICYVWPYIVDNESVFGADASKTDTVYFKHVGRMTFHARATWCEGSADALPPLSTSVANSRAPLRPSDLQLIWRQTMQLRSWRSRIWGSGAQPESAPSNLFGARVDVSEVAASCVAIKRPKTTGVQAWALVVPIRSEPTQASVVLSTLDATRVQYDAESVDTASRSGVPPSREIGDTGSEVIFNVVAGNDPTTWGQADAAGFNDVTGESGQPQVVSVTIAWPVGVSNGDPVLCQVGSSASSPLHVLDVMFCEVF